MSGISYLLNHLSAIIFIVKSVYKIIAIAEDDADLVVCRHLRDFVQIDAGRIAVERGKAQIIPLLLNVTGETRFVVVLRCAGSDNVYVHIIV